MLRVLSIILVICLAFGSFSFSSAIVFISDKVEYITDKLNSINGIGDIDFSLRIEGSTYNIDSKALTISHPSLNPDDNMTIRQFLSMLLDQYVSWYGYDKTGGPQGANVTVLELMNSISVKLYRVKICYMLFTNEYIPTSVYFDIPALRFTYNNKIYLYLDPFETQISYMNVGVPLAVATPDPHIGSSFIPGFTPIIANVSDGFRGVNIYTKEIGDGSMDIYNVGWNKLIGVNVGPYPHFLVKLISFEETEKDSLEYLRGNIEWDYNLQPIPYLGGIY